MNQCLEKVIKVGYGTGILLCLIAFFFGRVVAHGISAEQERAKAREIEGKTRLQREERVKKLYGRLEQ
jgi:hypothetical protein